MLRVSEYDDRSSLPSNQKGADFRFLENERGGITVFVLIFFVLLMVVGGMAVDYQRHDMARADLQNALDRGILAATNGEQAYDANGELTLDEQAAEIIYAYMASRTDLTSAVEVAASVTESAGGRSIIATASRTLDTIFLRMIGITELPVNVRAGAVQAAPKLEITLVLDVSHSMSESSASGGTKLAHLKVAAKEFVQTVLSADNDAQTLISIVPFSEQVNLPRWMADLYNLNRYHNYSSCFDFHSLDFSSPAMPVGTSYDQHQHFKERYSSSYRVFGSNIYSCPSATNAITPYSNDLDVLNDAVDALTVESWTASYMGVKWGTALLDTSSRPVVDAMIANGTLSEDFAGWPLAWNNPSVRKITVVMSDGDNTRLHEIRETDSSTKYSDHSVEWWDVNYPPSGYKYAVIDDQKTGEGDALLKDICDQNKFGQNATVYTIGFEVSDNEDAQAALQDCASSLSTYYLVEGVDISTAFQNIADEIVTLKLTN